MPTYLACGTDVGPVAKLYEYSSFTVNSFAEYRDSCISNTTCVEFGFDFATFVCTFYRSTAPATPTEEFYNRGCYEKVCNKVTCNTVPDRFYLIVTNSFTNYYLSNVLDHSTGLRRSKTDASVFGYNSTSGQLTTNLTDGLEWSWVGYGNDYWGGGLEWFTFTEQQTTPKKRTKPAIFTVNTDCTVSAAEPLAYTEGGLPDRIMACALDPFFL